MDPALRKAADEGDVKSLQELVAVKPDVIYSTTLVHENTALHVAASKGHTLFVHHFLLYMGTYWELAVSQNIYGETPMYLAERRGHLEVFEHLNQYLAWAKVLTDPALGKAADEGDVKSLQELVAVQPDVIYFTTMNEKNTALHIAASKGRTLFVHHFLLYMGTDGELTVSQNIHGDTPMHLAVRGGHLEVVEHLIQYLAWARGTNANFQGHTIMANKQGNTPLHVALFHRKLDIALKLLEDDPRCAHALNAEMLSPLYIAAREGHVRVVKKIAEQGLSTAFVSITGTALHQAVLGGSIEALEILLNNIVELVELTDLLGNNALHYVAWRNRAYMVSVLHKENSTLAYKKNAEQHTPLHMAAKYGSIEAARVLLEQCPDTTETVDFDGRNAFHIAIINNMIGVLDLLLKCNLPEEVLNKQDRDGNTPLHHAAKLNKRQSLRLLDDRRINSWMINKDGLTAGDYQIPIKLVEQLSDAIDSWDMLSLVDLLARYRNIVYSVTSDRKTTLHLAASRGNDWIVHHLLLCTNVNVGFINSKNIDGDTPLHLAVREDHLKVVHHLICYVAWGREIEANKLKMEKANWDEYHTRHFCEICKEETDNHNRPLGFLSRTGYKNLEEKFFSRTGKKMATKQFKNKWDLLKKEYMQFMELKNAAAGLGWNDQLGTIEADEDWWKTHLKKYPKHIKYKKKGPANLAEMDTMFDKVHISGAISSIPGEISDNTDGDDVFEEPLIMQNKEGNSLLHEAVIRDRYHLAVSLLDAGKEVTWAAAEEFIKEYHEYADDVVSIHDVLLIIRNGEWDTPLHIAAKMGNSGFVDMLISRAKVMNLELTTQYVKGPITMANKLGNTPLHNAVLHRNSEIALKLLEANPTCGHMENAAIESPLYIAVTVGLTYVVKKIADQGLYVASMSTHGTALHQSVVQDNIRALEILLNRYEKLVELTDLSGNNALHYASQRNNARMVSILLNKNSTLAYKKNNENCTPLHMAARFGSAEAAKELLKRFPDAIEMVDDMGQSALHIAVIKDEVNVLELLLKYVLPEEMVNKQDLSGNTPLHHAARLCRIQPALLLLNDPRVNPSLFNEDEQTAFALSGRKGILEMSDDEIRLWKELKKHKRRCEQQRVTTRQSRAQLLREAGTNTDIMIVVATLMSIATFAATLTMPGGYNRQSGTAIVGHHKAFKIFVVCNTMSMCGWNVLVLCFIWWSPMDPVKAKLLISRDRLMLLSGLGMIMSMLTAVYLTVAPVSRWVAYMTIAIGASTPFFGYLILK